MVHKKSHRQCVMLEPKFQLNPGIGGNGLDAEYQNSVHYLVHIGDLVFYVIVSPNNVVLF